MSPILPRTSGLPPLNVLSDQRQNKSPAPSSGPQAEPIKTTNRSALRPVRETIVDSQAYEAALADIWDDAANQKGFDWEMEKLRRYAAGLSLDENGGEEEVKW